VSSRAQRGILRCPGEALFRDDEDPRSARDDK
jgi:hypothetical protein